MKQLLKKLNQRVNGVRFKIALLAATTLAIVLYSNACTQSFIDSRALKEISSNTGGSSGGENTPSDETSNNDGDSDTPKIDYAKVNFSEHIAPIIHKNCTPCHQGENSIGPLPLVTLEHMQLYGDLVKQSIQERTMPPTGINASGDCRTFTEETYYLTDDQIELISAWMDNNMPPGDLSKVPKVVEDKLAIEKPDAILRMPVAYTPNPGLGSVDDYRCFIVDPGNKETVYMSDLEVVPGDPRVVHHAMLFVPNGIIGEGVALAKDLLSPGPGYACDGSAGTPSNILSIWAPGGMDMLETIDPEDGEPMGIEIPAGRKLVLQMHYNTEAGQFPDQTEIRIKYAKRSDGKKPKKLKWMLITNLALMLPPLLPNVPAIGIPQPMIYNKFIHNAYTQQTVINPLLFPIMALDGIISFWINPLPIPQDWTVYASTGHMHLAGRKIKLNKFGLSGLLEPGNNTCMLDVPNYDFNWQMAYRYEKPFKVAAGDLLQLNCNYDTRDRFLPTILGEGTNDEMCFAFLLVHEHSIVETLIPDAIEGFRENFPGPPNFPNQDFVNQMLSNSTIRSRINKARTEESQIMNMINNNSNEALVNQIKSRGELMIRMPSSIH